MPAVATVLLTTILLGAPCAAGILAAGAPVWSALLLTAAIGIATAGIVLRHQPLQGDDGHDYLRRRHVASRRGAR